MEGQRQDRRAPRSARRRPAPVRRSAESALVLLCLVVLLATAVAYVALASGGAVPTGTRAAGERGAVVGALVVGCLAAVGLGFVLQDQGDGLARSTVGLAWLVVALLLTVPAGWAFASAVSTDDAACGTLSTPDTAVQAPAPGQAELAAACGSRLDRQQALVLVLLLPAAGAAAHGLRQVLGRAASS